MRAFVVLTLLGSALALSQTGCVVGKKKYLALQEQLANTQRQCEEDRRMLRTQNEALQARLTAHQDSLRRQRALFDSLSAAYHERLRELTNTRQDLETVRSRSSAEVADLVSRLQELRQDLVNRELRLADVERRLRARDSVVTALATRLEGSLMAFRAQGMQVSTRNGKVYVSVADRLLFARGRTDIDTAGRSALRQLATVLQEQPEISITIEGHTDSLPITNLPGIKDNWDLSVKRSTEVTRYLTGPCGLDPRRIYATGRGEWQPVAPNSTPDGQARNRRIEIILTPNLKELYELLEADR
jgi:chemotaxis protein MotB